jgi:hypothetical protein
VTLTGFVSIVPAEWRTKALLAANLSTIGQMPIFLSKVHSPVSLYHGLSYGGKEHHLEDVTLVSDRPHRRHCFTWHNIQVQLLFSQEENRKGQNLVAASQLLKMQTVFPYITCMHIHG